MEERLLYPVDETATLLGLGVTKTWELIRDGELEVVRVGRATRVPRRSIEGFVARLATPDGASETVA